MPRQIKRLPHFDAPVVDIKTGRMTREWYTWFSDFVNTLTNRIAISGSVTFVTATTAAVTFGTPEADANYQVWFNSTDNKTYWASSKTVSGFTANASAASSETVGWQLIRA